MFRLVLDLSFECYSLIRLFEDDEGSSHCHSCLSLFVSEWNITLMLFYWLLVFEFWKMAAPRTGVKSMKDYLKKYESSEVIEKKKKKKMKKPSKPEPTGVLVVDEDPVWQKQVDPQEEQDNENDSAGNALNSFFTSFLKE